MRHIVFNSLVVSLAAGVSTASRILYAAYSGQVASLNIPYARTSTIPDMKIANNSTCGYSSSWLTLDHKHEVLYCLDAGLPTTGSGIVSLAAPRDGSLTYLNRASTTGAPVGANFIGNTGLVVPHYFNGLSTWDISKPSAIRKVEFDTFNGSGPNPRQEGPHLHEAVIDPTGTYLIVPDLGADLVRIFTFNTTSLHLEALAPLNVPVGSGPRHVAFAVKCRKTFMYLVTELTSDIIGYEVTYNAAIQFRQMFAYSVHGQGKHTNPGARAAEIVVSVRIHLVDYVAGPTLTDVKPDNNYIIVSSRGDNTLSIPDFHSNGQNITSDPLINYSIGSDGSITVLQEVAAGGRYPQQFSINKAGDMVAVGFVEDNRVAVIERDLNSGLLGKFIAYADVPGNVSAVVFGN